MVRISGEKRSHRALKDMHNHGPDESRFYLLTRGIYFLPELHDQANVDS